MDNGLFGAIYNPDVLSCLANLSNDEVFTPPEVVNQMLDMLPQELFSNPDTTFLDPACKTGVHIWGIIPFGAAFRMCYLHNYLPLSRLLESYFSIQRAGCHDRTVNREKVCCFLITILFNQ